MDTSSVKRGALSCALAGTLALAGTAIAAEGPAEESAVPAAQEVAEAVEKPEVAETSTAPEDADQGDDVGRVEGAGQGADAAPVQDDGATEGAAPAEDLPAEEDYPFDWYYFDGSQSTGHSGAVITLDETYAEATFTVPATVGGYPVIEVNAAGLDLMDIDVSACAGTMYKLTCPDNYLEALDLSACEALEILDCSNNLLEDLILPMRPVSVDCSENQLTKLVAWGSNATMLDCSSNKLESLTYTGGFMLDCSDNMLKELRFWGRALDCSNNLLESLDVALQSGGTAAPTWLDCSNNQLTELDLSRCEYLVRLDCTDNLLTELELGGSFLADGESPELGRVLNCQYNYIADTSALEAWIAIEGHEGQVTPQRDPGQPDQPDAPESGAAELFDDVDPSEWYVTGGYLDFVVSRGIMGGYTDAAGEPTGLFGPHDPLTRAQAATVIYRLVMGSAAPLGDGADDRLPFTDVEAGEWYTEAVLWCSANGIVTGYTDAEGNPTGLFGPNDLVTREQLATMVWRLACLMGAAGAPGTDLSSFSDAGEVSDYALDALAWCNACGIVTGDLATGTPMLVPGGDATRCQTAKIITVTAQVIGL